MDINKEAYYIVRSAKAGVFFGHIEAKRGDEVDMEDARRIWYWMGAASISQLAMEGVKNPKECKFTVSVPKMTVLDVCEIIECTKEAVECIKGVPEWRL